MLPLLTEPLRGGIPLLSGIAPGALLGGGDGTVPGWGYSTRATTTRLAAKGGRGIRCLHLFAVAHSLSWMSGAPGPRARTPGGRGGDTSGRTCGTAIGIGIGMVSIVEYPMPVKANGSTMAVRWQQIYWVRLFVAFQTGSSSSEEAEFHFGVERSVMAYFQIARDRRYGAVATVAESSSKPMTMAI